MNLDGVYFLTSQSKLRKKSIDGQGGTVKNSNVLTWWSKNAHTACHMNPATRWEMGNELLILGKPYFIFMIKIIASLLVCTLLSASVFGQSTDEKAVEAAVEKLRKAMLAADKAALESLTAEELSYGHSSGLIEDKAAFINQFVTGKSVFKTIALSDQSIKISGNTAIVRHRLIGDTNNNNVPGKVDILVLLVWQKQNGEWKLLARQAAKIPPKA
jgi:ketosteroid isomerase-like protein